jgi:hypothetical protein
MKKPSPLKLFAVALATSGLVFIFGTSSLQAAINPMISFQGKLTNPDGTNVTDGSYSVRFRIYTDPTADTGACANTCKWEETQASVTVTGGLFHVNLGSSTALPGSVDFNGNTLYLGVKVGTDAEMTPRIRLTAAPYAFNSDLLDGLDAGAFVQLSPGSQQTGSINISGTLSSGAVNGITIGSTIQPSSAGSLTIQANGSNALNLTGGAASTWDIGNNLLSLQTTSNGPITTGTGLWTQGGNLTFSGSSARTITGPGTGGLVVNVTSGPLTLSTTTSGALAVSAAGALNLSAGAASTLNVGSNTLTVTASNFSVSSAGAITAATSTNTINNLVINNGSLTNVGANITASGALTVASGSSSALTLDSASNTLQIAASDTTIQRTASGTTTLNLVDGSNTVLSITNSGAGAASINVDGGYQVGGVAGSTVSCTGGQFLQGQTVAGGIVTGGSCGSLPIRSFIDSTADAVADNSTTSYWDNGAENNNTRPNLAPSASDKEVFGILTMETQSTGTADVEVTARVERSTSGSTACNSGTAVGGQPGTFASNTNARKTSTTSFLDTPASTSTQYYNVCSDTDTVGTTANITRLRMTLFEVDSSNADLAEVYPTLDKTLQAGELVSLDAGLKAGVKRTTRSYDPAVVGVVSTSPALVIGGRGDDTPGAIGIPVALSGRVPVLVSDENGPILPGDPLTASSVPGVAMKATAPGYVIGRAMQAFNLEGQGAVLAFVGTHYYAPFVSGQDIQDSSTGLTVGSLTINGPLTVINDAFFQGKILAKDIRISGHLAVGPDTAGTAIIPAGQTSTEVIFRRPHDTVPKVTTGISDFLNVRVENKTTAGFHLSIPAAQSRDVLVDWTAVELEY